MSSTHPISSLISNLGNSIKSIVKMTMQSRHCDIKPVPDSEAQKPLIIMGNGPSLRDTINTAIPTLKCHSAMAVNFAANTPEFYEIKPSFYVLADPHFFTQADENVELLWSNLARRVDWPMTLFIPSKFKHCKMVVAVDNIKIKHFNPVGVEGFKWLENRAFFSGLGMPRPRNVLIPALMIGLKLGYRDIYIVGADHSWMKTLDVDDQNRVISVQPHYYKDNESEKSRVNSVYANIRLHQIINSFYVAFKAYHSIARYATHRGVNIYNSTPGSFIDAFPRRPLPHRDAKG